MTPDDLYLCGAKMAAIRIAMAEEGWTSHDDLTEAGWGGEFGYSIWFERWDWHGALLIKITGEKACYHAHRKGLDRQEMLEATEEAAALARKAWVLFACEGAPPVQTVHGFLRGR